MSTLTAFRQLRPSGTALALVLLALVLYGSGLSWGLPHATAPDRDNAWGVDDGTPLEPLAEMHNIIAPTPDRNLGYPLMHSFMVSAAYAPYLGYLWAKGDLTTISGTYPYGLTDPVGALRVLTWIAHALSTVLGAALVLAVYLAGRRLWDRPTGVLASLFAMTSFPMFYYTRTGNVDVPVLFFTALALAGFAFILVEGFTARNALVLGAGIGFALATKEPSFASFVAIPFVLLPLHWRRSASSPRSGETAWASWSFWRLPLFVLLAAFLSFGAGSGWFVDSDRFYAHLAFARDRVGMLAGGNVAFIESYPHTWDGHVRLARAITGYLIDAMTWPGLLLSVAGVGWTLRREPLKAAFVLPAVTYLLVLFWLARGAQLRYVMPAALTLAFFAARAVTCAWASRRSWVRYGAAVSTAGVLGLSLLRGVDLTHAMLNDARYDAARWLAARTRPGDRVEYFGSSQKLPALPEGVITATATEYRGAVHQPPDEDEAAREIVAGWRARKPPFVIVMPDHSSAPGSPYSATCPPQIYEALHDGSIGYRLAAHFETPSLLGWVRRPALDYPTVNPPIRIFVPVTDGPLP
jgi:hypothetical protein